ncbi:MAG: hypothetical protein JRN37_09900 [Nitrososphaerota archaeon]|jgi:hypothetical protein|nr:hypothetical protein [Nitrososphaerota archaeon]MDG7039442.1 hypothetical protein [Nitrososphaerota archaeon]
MKDNENTAPIQHTPGKIAIKETMLGISKLEYEPDNCCETLKAENRRLRKENAMLKEKLKHALIPIDEEVIGETELEGQ